VKWLALAIVALSCSAPPPAIVPSPTQATHTLRVVAAGAVFSYFGDPAVTIEPFT